MKRWNKEEIELLKKLFPSTRTENLALKMNRSYSSIVYKAGQLKLTKDPKKGYKTRRFRPEIKVSKEIFEDLYIIQQKSIRVIASELGIGKNTVDYYLDKYQIPKRTAGQSNLIYYSRNSNWCKGKSKENDNRIQRLSEKIKLTWELKKREKVKKIERIYNNSLRQVIIDFYHFKKYNQDQIAKKLNFSRKEIIDLMRDYNIPKRDNFAKVVQLSRTNHPHKNLTWEEIHSPVKAKKLKKAASVRFRRLILERISRNDFLFHSTKIEEKIRKELECRNIPYKAQYRVLGKYSLDFAIPSKLIAIECDGDYWHSNPDLYSHSKLSKQQQEIKKRDLAKDKELRDNGWVVLRFFETDINKNIKKCVNLIEYIYFRK